MNSQDSMIEKDNQNTPITPEVTPQENLQEPTVVNETEVAPTLVEAKTPEVAELSTDDTSEVNIRLDEPSAEQKDLTKTEMIARLKELEDLEVNEIKEEVENIKSNFYKKCKAETELQRALHIENGGSDDDFVATPTELEDEFKALYNDFKDKKAKLSAHLDLERENNLAKKNSIIEQLKQLVESKEDVSANINTFRQLQQDWKTIGQVPPSASNDLWKQYNQQQESFWDLIKINNELREYDFRKNLEAKLKLIEAAEALDKDTEIVSAFRQLQKLHEDWRELGPVAREMRDEVWNKFKEASSVINKKHQGHFDEIREIEQVNLDKKTQLCERIEAVDFNAFKVYKEWDEATKSILEMQEEWRTIGFAPHKANQKVFERYRDACDKFFAAKAEFYKEVKTNLSENLDRKKALCEKVEALKDSTDWKATTDEMVKLQKEWKTIGPVQKKFSDEVWKRFIAACDYFFEQKNKNMSGQKTEELKNLDIKKGIIEKIKAFKKTDNIAESLSALRALAAEWNSVGHVPFREKDKIYKEYRAVLDAKFDELNIDASQRRLESFKSNLKDISSKGENKIYREREKLVRAYEHQKSEIETYENNIGFLSVSSKKGGGMLQEMERKIEALKDECKLLEQKINMIDEQI